MYFFIGGFPDSLILVFVLLAIIILFIVGFVIALLARKHRYKKILKDLERRYENAHALLVGQDSQFIRRLEFISQRNLLYVDIHHLYLERYNDIKDNLDHQADMAIGALEDMLDKRKYHGIKETFKTNKELVLYFEEQVDLLNKELKEALKNEEKCRVDALSQKEKLRNVKQIYFDHQSELLLVEDSFNIVFGNIDKAFEKFEDCIDCANYDEVSSILGRIEEVINELNKVIKELPTICSLIENVVPERIGKLKEEYNRMTNDDYPLHHLRVNSLIDEMNNELSSISVQVKQLNIDGLSDKLVNMCDRCENLINQFAYEKEAKNDFVEHCKPIYEKVNRLEKDFIKMCNIIPEIKNNYLIEDSYIDKIEEMRAQISQLGTIKRTLDNFIHSATKQPYSLLLSKMTALDKASTLICESMDQFQKYLESLESDSNNCSQSIYDAYFKLKNAEKDVRSLHVESLEDTLQIRFQQAYVLIDRIDLILEKKPINVRELNETYKTLSIIMEQLIKDIDDKKALCVACEEMVVYANKDRHRLSDVKMLLNQVETSFFDGDFEKAYCDVGNIVKRIQGHVN